MKNLLSAFNRLNASASLVGRKNKFMVDVVKHWFTKSNLIFVSIIIFAGLVRFYNFPNRVTFWSEQARSLIVSAEYLVKPSFLGQEYFRQDVNGHMIFSGALFNYSLVPLLLIAKFDPVAITVFFVLLNMFTGIVIYFVVRRILNEKMAAISAFLFLFNDFMIYHSLFIWNYNYLPLIGILIFYFSWLNIKKHKMVYSFILGLLSGIGISLQVLFGVLALLVITVNIWKSKEKIKDIIFFFTGAILGNLPMVLFDLRHDFYQTRTLWQFFLDTIGGRSDAGFAYYYFLPFWPIAAVILGYLLWKLSKKYEFLVFGLLTIYLFLNLTSGRVSFTSTPGMPKGIAVADVEKASNAIAKDSSGPFNVSEVLDFDKRAYVLRYYIQYKYGKTPKDVTQYQNLNKLYVLSQKDYNFMNSGVWEINAGGPYKISKLTDVDFDYAVYKLEK